MVYAFRVYDGRFGAFQILPTEEDGLQRALVNPLRHQVILGTRTDLPFRQV